MNHNIRFKEYELISYQDISEKEKWLILDWRNDDTVRKFMVERKIISHEEHLLYLESLEYMKNKRCFLVKEKEDYLGVIEFCDIADTSSEIALSKNPDAVRVGKKLMECIDYVAREVLHLKKLTLSVLNYNEKAIALYIKEGFVQTSKDEFQTQMEKEL